MSTFVRSTLNLFGAYVDIISWEDLIYEALKWANCKQSKYIVFCNVHSLITAYFDKVHCKAINSASFVGMDGMPVVWLAHKLGYPNQLRINGPDFMWKFCGQAEKSKQKIFLYGNTTQTLILLQNKLKENFPLLQIVGFYSPPFRELTDSESISIIEHINSSDANLVFVSLGCPTQERWMNKHSLRIKAVLVGVGAAFDYHAGTLERAPTWMQQRGLEWFFRLCKNPRKLWKRYLVTNTAFIFLTLKLLFLENANKLFIKSNYY